VFVLHYLIFIIVGKLDSKYIMFNKLKNLFKRAPESHWADAAAPEVIPPKVRAKRRPAAPKKVKNAPLTDKETATAAGEPYVAILKIDIDPNNINNGAFELDWNDKFLLNLIKSGYKMKDDDKDSDIVDRWWAQVCRGVVMEMYEQEQADPEKRDLQPLTPVDERVINRKPLGDGRSEIS
jgi:hypothetical protein